MVGSAATPRPGAAAVAFDSFPRALDPPSTRVGGRLQAFLPAWSAITEDTYVLSVIKAGFVIHLAEPLPGGVMRVAAPRRSPDATRSIAAEVTALCRKGVVEQTSDHPRLCLSPVFLVPKRSGKYRMILNLKRINTFIAPIHFRMETLRSILPMLRPGDWTVSIDLKDAYHHIPIATGSRALLGFEVGGKVYRFRALPFGLKPAPRLFTRIVTCVAVFLRRHGLRIFCYLDDWLLVASSRSILLEQLAFLLRTVQNLGFIVNWEKSELTPTQRPTFLGATIDIPAELARPSSGRIDTITAAAARLRRSRRAPARLWLQFLGYLASLVDVMQDCRLIMRPFQLHLLKHYRPAGDPLTRLIHNPPLVRRELARWTKRASLLVGKPLRTEQPTVTVTTDASHQGWGGHCMGRTAFGDWPQGSPRAHINMLELQAVLLSLQSFLPLLRHRTVLVRTDNVTVAAYINRQGGTHSTRLNALATQLWKWCRLQGITPVASYIPGQENLVADFLSRGRVLPSEWTLHPDVFRSLIRELGPLKVDLFASALNARLPTYCAKTQDPAAWQIDAFAVPWTGIRAYAFPPFALIPQVLRKIRQDRASVVLIAPWWPRRSWFLDMIDLLVSYPLTLPLRPDLLSQPISGEKHPRLSTLHLTAWPLSGNPQLRRVFRSALPLSSQAAGGIPLWVRTTHA